jgi:hypothetical protein
MFDYSSIKERYSMKKKESILFLLSILTAWLIINIAATNAFSAGKAMMRLNAGMMKKHPVCSLLLLPEKSRTLSMGTFSFLRALCSGQSNASRSYKTILQHGSYTIGRITNDSDLSKKMLFPEKFEDIKGDSIDSFLLSGVNDSDVDFANRSSQNSPVVIADTAHNTLIYAFRDTGNFRNQPGGSMIGWAISADHGDSWTDMGSVPALSDTQWLYGDPSLACALNGRCYLAAVGCNVSGCTGDKVEVAITTDGGQTWSDKINAVPMVGQWEKPVLAVDNTGGLCNGDVYLVA